MNLTSSKKPKGPINNLLTSHSRPSLAFLLCLVEKATRPFDLPYLTPRSARPSSLLTCRVSALMANIMSAEVTSDDSISRRASAASSAPSSTALTTTSRHKTNRPNSHTQHAAAIAASTLPPAAAPHVGGGGGGGPGGPRPPPASVKEARPWSFTKFDDRTKRQLAASVSEASHSSETRPRVGGPRPLAASDIAVRTGVLPPPVCTEPKRVEMPQREREREREAGSQELVVRSRSGAGPGTPSGAAAAVGGGGGWKGEWSALRSITGWYSPANSSATTPVSTPGPEYGPPPGSQHQQQPHQQQSRNRPLSTVAEDPAPHGRREITYHQPAGAAATSPSVSAPAELEGSSAAAAAAAAAAAMVPAQVARRARTVSHAPEPPPYTTTAAAPAGRPRCLTGPRGPEPQPQQLVGGYPFDTGAGMPRLPAPAAAAAAAAPSPARAPTTARVRLQRAQDALKTHGRTMSGTMVLNRPQRLTGERRGSVDDRVALRAPVRGGGGEGRLPGSFVD